MSLLRRPYAYSKVESEDPEEKAHRQAQFLIYKVLEQVDLQSPKRRQRRRPFSLGVRICKVKVKIGKRLKKLRKNISAAKNNLYRKMIAQLKCLKGLIRGGETAMVSLPAPMLN
ncbi:uncharacterized protein LOC122640894 [Telopea speciosissima]|uniref:uncharacterized protein LOC122640894 n=1 Tax=Telopea speciosissima TaxID=54955 RepID=UPI001CC58001|nr:uncharacterized protein LOC122640894 [Telopea speciosissima]